MEILIVRKHRMRFCAKEINVADIEKTHEENDIALERGVLKVAIHIVKTLEELLKHLGPKGDHKRKAHRRVYRITAAHPAPEAKGIVGVDAKFRNQLQVSRNSNKMLSNRSLLGSGRAVDSTLLLERRKKPFPGHARVCHGFEGGESLGNDDHQRGFRIEVTRLFCHIGRVDIRDVAHRKAFFCKRFERLVRHNRAQVRTTNTNGNDSFDLFIADTFP